MAGKTQRAFLLSVLAALVWGCDAVCSDGVVQKGEACDDGNALEGDGCDSNCTPTGCGNGVITQGEDCEDQNNQDGDGCSNQCALEEGFRCEGTPSICTTVCGDGIVRGEEECDDGDQDDTDACTSLCLNASCGDGLLQAGVEECDDGNNTDADGCEADCSLPACGNGIQDPGEICLQPSGAIILGVGEGAPPSFIEVADFNADGKEDLAVGVTPVSSPDRVSISFGNGDGTFPGRDFIDLEHGANIVASGDFNEDGFLDVFATGTVPQGTSLTFNNGDGTFQSPQLLGGLNGFISEAELDGDGVLDLISRTGTEVLIAIGNGDGTFQPQQSFPVDGGISVVEDFNGDGALDLVGSLSADPGGGNILLGNGDGTFQPQQPFAVGTDLGSFMIAGDCNADSKVDLITFNRAATTVAVFVLLGNGDGTFQPPQGLTTSLNNTFNQSGFMAGGDFNGDGTLDLVIADEPFDRVFVYSGNGDGTFQEQQQPLPTNNSPRALAVGDFDGDGKSDLAVANLAASNVSIFLTQGAVP
jgi:cysteine-rich repeat protein